MKRASAGGVSIAYEDAGRGEPALLLMAGWCADHTAFRELAPLLSKSPLEALARLDPPVETLHLYATPDDPAYLTAQREFAASHPWFRVERLAARSHFPTLEVPVAIAGAIDRFLTEEGER